MNVKNSTLQSTGAFAGVSQAVTRIANDIAAMHAAEVDIEARVSVETIEALKKPRFFRRYCFTN